MTEIKLNRVHGEDDYNVYTFDICYNNRVVGYAEVEAVDEDDEHAYCSMIVIDKETRNFGIGTDALNQLSAKWYGIEIAPDNEDARRLYERLGEESSWENADFVDQGYGVYRI